MITEILSIIIIALIGVVSYFLKDKFKNFEVALGTVKYNIKTIANALNKTKSIDFDHSYLRDYSPLGITPEGEKYLERTGFIQIFNEYSNEFFTYIDSEKPTTKFDVESIAREAVMLLSDKNFCRPIKIHLYNNPKENILSFAKIAGVYLRDKYLEKHPEITQ